MTWHKIILTNDQVKEEEHVKLQNEFRKLWRISGLKKEVALFAGSPYEKKDEYPYYFSPACSQFADTLISFYSGTPCEKPKKGELHPALLCGHPDARDFLLD